MPRFLNIQPNSRTPDLRFAFRWPCLTPTCLPLNLTGVWHSGVTASTDSSIGLRQGYAIDFSSPITCSGDMAPASSMPSPGRSERYSVENRRNTNSRRTRDSSDTRCICVWTTWCIELYLTRNRRCKKRGTIPSASPSRSALLITNGFDPAVIYRCLLMNRSDVSACAESCFSHCGSSVSSGGLKGGT